MKSVSAVRKILQALYYIQSKAPRQNDSRYNIVYLLKMIYAADRYHLRHYGILVTGDSYFAMKLGPVGSMTYNILKKSSYDINLTEFSVFSAINDMSEHEVSINRQGDDELSESVKTALDFALREFGGYPWSELSDISHNYPEWKKHAAVLLSNCGRVPMEIRDFFDDPVDDNCFASFGKACDPYRDDKEFLALMKEDFDENSISA